MSVLELIFIKVLYASLAASFLIVLMLLAKKLLNFRLSPMLQHALWFLVLIRLLIPVVSESPLSIFNVVTQSWHAATGYVNSIIENSTGNNTSKSNVYSYKQKKIHTNKVIDTVKVNNVTNDNNQEKFFTKQTNSNKITVPSTAEKNTLNQMIIKVLSCLWFIIFISLIISDSIFTYKFKKRVQKSSLVTDAQITSILNECRSKLKIKKNISIYTANNSNSPFVADLLKPKIYFPKDILNEIEKNQLAHVLMHELAHYKRRDLLYNFFAVAGTALHWFNPLVWIAIKKMKEDSEIACDAYVLGALGENEANEYGITLIKVSRLSKFNRTRLSPVTFYESKSQLERRILMINKFENGTNKLSALTLAVCLIVGSITLTNATTSNGKADFAKGGKDSSAFKVNNYYKNIFDLRRASSFTNVNFKVPDFIPDGKKFMDAWIENKILDNEDVISIRFFGGSSDFRIGISKGNLLKELISDETSADKRYKCTINKDSKTISDIKGTYLTIHGELINKEDAVSHKVHMTDSNGKDTIVTSKVVTTRIPLEYTKNYFLWQDKGINYWIDYCPDSVDSSKKANKTSISEEDFQRTIKSFRYLKDIKNISYHSFIPDNQLNQNINIYEESDLISAKKMLGFKVIIPSDLPEGLLLTSATANNQSINDGITNKNCKQLWTTYDTKPYDSRTKQSQVEFFQSNSNANIRTLNKSNSKILKVNGVEVFTNKPNAYTLYTWRKNKIYYALYIVTASKVNQRKILNELVK